MSTGAASAMAELDASAIGALAELVAGPASIPTFGVAAAPAAEPGLQSSPEFTSTWFLPSAAWTSPSSCQSAVAFAVSAAATTACPFSDGSKVVARENFSSS